MSYKHFTTKEREFIEKHLNLGRSRRFIAKKLGRHHSSVCDEINRNVDAEGKYTAFRADVAYLERREKRIYNCKDNDFLEPYIKDKILLTWSPEQISNRLKLEFPDDSKRHISTNKIYSLIYSRKIIGITRKNLRKKGKRFLHTHWKSPKIKGAVHISKRTKKAENRIEIGHWENDTVRSRKSKDCLGTFVDRKSRFVIISLLNNGKADEFNKGAVSKFKDIPKSKIKTFTFDNGSEFANHLELKENLKIKTYFTNKHSPWQRPTNENTNGLIREFYPKKFDFSTITQNDVDNVANLINNRPRKCLNWYSAAEIFDNKKSLK